MCVVIAQASLIENAHEKEHLDVHSATLNLQIFLFNSSALKLERIAHMLTCRVDFKPPLFPMCENKCRRASD
jgi:hypothetical protein